MGDKCGSTAPDSRRVISSKELIIRLALSMADAWRRKSSCSSAVSGVRRQQRRIEQANGLQGLAQVMARRGEEPGLRHIGAVRFLARSHQGIVDGAPLRHIANRRGDKGLLSVMNGSQADAGGKFAAIRAPRKQIDDACAHFPRRGIAKITSQVSAVAQSKAVRHEHFDGLPDELLSGVAEQAARGGIGEENDPVGVYHDERIR